MSSLGYVLTNWTSEFIKVNRRKSSSKKEKKFGKKIRSCANTTSTTNTQQEKQQQQQQQCQKISFSTQTTTEISKEPPPKCLNCPSKLAELNQLETKLNSLNSEMEILNREKLNLKDSLTDSEKRIRELVSDNESVSSQLKSLHGSMDRQLEQRDQAHSERIKLLEQVMNDKDIEWVKRHESLQKELRNALTSSLLDTDREEATMKALEQEIESLHSVIDLRTEEIHDLRGKNQELNRRLERYFWLENELSKSKQKMEEMGMIIQGKIHSEQELLSMMDSLQNELIHTKSESDQYRRELENRQYLINHQSNKMNHHRAKNNNNNNGASSGEDSGLVLDVVEKMDSVAWMIQMPATNGGSGVSPRTQK